ncbi:hypothetical protein V8G54_028591 [Vigna mungo]|uniref:Uncharacterized protein n=1 Tax=Vigna mungo TaxID=3915 RepID=A0AAQ3MSP0_VIGMU
MALEVGMVGSDVQVESKCDFLNFWAEYLEGHRHLRQLFTYPIRHINVGVGVKRRLYGRKNDFSPTCQAPKRRGDFKGQFCTTALTGCFSRFVDGGEGFARKQMMNKLGFWFVLRGVPLVHVLGFLPCRRMKAVLDLGFIDDRFHIRDELAIGLYGLWRNKPECEVNGGFVSRYDEGFSDRFFDCRCDTLAYGGAMEEKTCLQSRFYDLDGCFYRFHGGVVLDNGDSRSGCVRTEMQTMHGSEAVVEDMMELAILGLVDLVATHDKRWWLGELEFLRLKMMMWSPWKVEGAKTSIKERKRFHDGDLE